MITMKIIIMFLVLIPVIAFSQETVTPFEFEVAIGPNWGIQKQKGEDVRTGLNVFMEMRYNYKACFDFGMQLFVGAYERLNNNDNSETIYRNVIIQPVADYNFRQGKKVNPFVGLGIGLAAIDIDNDRVVEKSYCVNPRIGAEFFHHVRVTFEYRLLRTDYSFWGCSIGIVFGGGNKKQN